VFSFVAAVVVFCVVQDRLTARGAREYVRRQQAAFAGTGPAVTIDQVMKPAVRRSVLAGFRWSGVVMAAGLVTAGVVSRRRMRG
jgi:hypothetical protein